MLNSSLRMTLARVLFYLGGLAGLFGVITGLSRHSWRMGTDGWLLLALLGVTGSLTLLLDEYISTKRP